MTGQICLKTRNKIMTYSFSSIILLSLGTCLLAGCSTMSTGTTQPILVDTGISGATCTLSNDRGVWHLADTPDTVIVHRSHKELAVSCKHTSGLSSVISVPAKSNKKKSFMQGGWLAISYDMSTGALYEYPTLITVNLK